MDSNVKALWIEALASEEYEQGTAYLNRNGRFCCLGVLCDIAVREGVIDAPEEDVCDDDHLSVMMYGETQENNHLPWEVQDWASINDGGGKLPEPLMVVNNYGPNEALTSLWELNDIAKWSFERIAQVIDENF